MKKILLIILISAAGLLAQISGLRTSPYFNEQTITFYYHPEIRVHINAPSVAQFDTTKSTALALFALPNGNTIEHTIGKILLPGDDWHYDIQHIGAQTRFLRQNVSEYNVVTIYLETKQLSWPSWKASHANHAQIIQQLFNYLMGLFNDFQPYIVLTGHSGGGRFTFSFLDGVSQIPASVKRISFLDSNYGYENSYGDKIINWLNASPENHLSVIAYNDSVALYNGLPIVSPTGGTWYRSRMMKNYMANFFTFTDSVDTNFIRYTALNGRVKFILKQNPNQAILHTVQVERNGHIQGMVSGTTHEDINYVYYGARAYSQWIQTNIDTIQQLLIPPRPINARSGSQFMQDVMNMTFANREVEIYNEVSIGNIPDFIRNLVTIDTTFQDANGVSHTVQYEVMPDYLAIGSNTDFCRIPTGPIKAQLLADLFGAVMPTRKLVDNIYSNCSVKLAPVTYLPVGNQNELVPKFIEHNTDIEALRLAAEGQLGDLTGGTKKDVVLSNKIIDPSRPNHVTIYGWHQLNGSPIQPLTNIHTNTYVDYSHGIRYLNNEFLLDGQVKKITEVLTDPVLYKVFSDENGVMTQPTYVPDATLPTKPRSFGVRSAGSGSLEIVINPGSNVDAYRLFIGLSAGNILQGYEYPPGNIVIDGLTDGQIYYFKLKARNIAGSSAESEVLAGIPGIQPNNSFLIVNGFDRASTGNTYDFIEQHGRAVQNHGAVFESATNDAVLDGLFNLNDYTMVDYILGEESTVDETFGSAEQLLVQSYLQNGGNLFVSGCELAWDLDWRGSTSDKSFLHNFLKVKYIDDSPGGAVGTHYNITPMSSGIFTTVPAFAFDDGTHGSINVKWPDVLQEVNGSQPNLLYTGFNASYGCAGVQFQGYFPSGTNFGSVVVMGIPFESIYPESVRYQVMDQVVTYFEIASGISNKTDTYPNEFSLQQNFPNPFNPTTNITYNIPQSTQVQLVVYNVLGQKITTLVNQHENAGKKLVKWDGKDELGFSVSSGVYVYQIRAGDFLASQKMLLAK